MSACKLSYDVDVVCAVPYHPQVQFLTDVDNDGLIDHLYCCEAAVMELANHCVDKGLSDSVLGDVPLTPLFFEAYDKYCEARKALGYGSDAGYDFPLIPAILHDDPLVIGDKKFAYVVAETYRSPVDAIQAPASKVTPNHSLLVVGTADDSDADNLVLHCTYNGVAVVDFDAFNAATRLISVPSSVVDYDDVLSSTSGKTLAECAEYIVYEYEVPVVASVSVLHMKVVDKTGTVPFVVVTKGSWYDDWYDGLSYDVPDDKDDRACYLEAVINKDNYPTIEFMSWKDGSMWLSWLRKNESLILSNAVG